MRWWPAAGILLLALGVVVWVRGFEDTDQQRRNLQTLLVAIVAGLLLFVWCVGFSRLSRRIRGAVVLILVVGLVAGGLTLRIRGVTGDLLPVFEWRWRAGVNPAALAPEPAATSTLTAAISAPDGWPQFRGPHRDSTLPALRLVCDWQAHPPREIWRRPVGAGWAGFAVARGIAVTQEQRGGDELVTAYDAATGRPLWTHADTARYATTIAGEGPRSTPAIDGDVVYTLGATGGLNCLDLRTGRELWGKNIMAENAGEVPVWGLSVSPLVLGDRVIVSAGGKMERSLVAYDKRTGERVWGGGHDRAGYSSPALATLAGVPQILIFNQASVAGHAADTGRLLWEYPWPATHPHVANPQPLPGDRVLVSSGYGWGSELLQIRRTGADAWSATRVWKSPRLKAKFANFVALDGFVYGLDDGILVCLDAATGELKWKAGRYGHGQLILTGNALLVTAEDGTLVLVDPVPEAHRERARFTAFRSKTWNPPALAGEFLLVRNDLEAACFQLPVEKPASAARR